MLENTLSEGTMLNVRYQIIGVLGRGGAGVTYKAYDSKCRRHVAIKELFPPACCGRNPGEKAIFVYSENAKPIFQDFLNHFQTEGHLLMSLESPNLVKIYDYFEENNTAYIVMELLHGCDLDTYWKRKGRKLSEKEICLIVGELLDVLEYIHKKGIIHRDICLKNIFITDLWKVKLIDFGAAFPEEGTDGRSVILRSYYASPEQYYLRGRLGPWTDLYALGAVMYALASGQAPLSVVERMEGNTLVPPKKYNPQISMRLNDVIMRAMCMKIEERYQSAAEFRKGLLGKVGTEKRTLLPEQNKKRLLEYVVLAGITALMIMFCVTLLLMRNG